MHRLSPLRRGHFLLVTALNSSRWTQYELARRIGRPVIVITRVVKRLRGVGLVLAGLIEDALPGQVPLSSWREVVSPEEEKQYAAGVLTLIERGRNRRRRS